MKTIFLVTVISEQHTRNQRTWGWFPTFEEAEKAVLSNATDMFECNYYNLAVIEEVESGLIAHVVQEKWYKAVYSSFSGKNCFNPQVSEIPKPKCFKYTVNFGMG